MVDPNKEVTQEHIFHFRDGSQAHSVADLKEVLETMPMDEFNHHVDEFNNDFANWVEFIYKDDGLANDLRKVTSQKQTIEILEIELGKYVGKKETTEIKESVEKKSGLYEDPIKPTTPPQSISMPNGDVHHTISTEAAHHFIVKEFIYGAIAGILVGILLMGMLMTMGIFG